MDIYNKPSDLDEDIVGNLGPFSPLVGSWEGDKGVDVSPSRKGPAETRYRERLSLEAIGPVVNGPQVLYGLKYAMVAWPLNEDKPFHEELGYWLWDPKEQQAMRCFMVPRGVTLIAGGRSDPQAKTIEMSAEVGSETYGILSNPFLNDAFKTIRYDLKITIINYERFGYHEDTQLKLFGQEEVFHHTDENTLVKCG